jgi:adenine-specific DNA-methyltransferase
MAKNKYVHYSKEQLIAKIKQLEKHRYGLVWEDKPEDIADKCANELPVLVEDKSKEIISNTDKPTNFIFEGDNYHTLYTLNFTHKKKIDVIYIDPPYNTGKENEWRYNDKYIDSNDRFRHSKWLSFLNKRLRLSKGLLKENGIILISIDDNELAQLKILCNKVFLEKNFIGIIIRKTKSITSDAKSGFNIQHEYCLAYAKNINFVNIQGIEKTYDSYSNKDNDPRGEWTSSDPTAMDDGREVKNIEPIVNPYTNRKDYPGKGRRWRFNTDGFEKLVSENRIVFKKEYKSNERGFILKRYKNELKSEFNVAQSLSKELAMIFGDKVFDFPKPVKFIKDLVLFTTSGKEDVIILDFFAGSGTTGQAVIELNKEDNGSRQFILCTNDENNICNEVTYPRIEKVIKGYSFNGEDKTTLLEKKLTLSNIYKNVKQKNNESEEEYILRKEKIINDNLIALGKLIDDVIANNQNSYDKIEKQFKNNTIKILGIKNVADFKEGIPTNIKYFKTDFVPNVLTDKDKRTLVSKSTELLCIAENTFDVVSQKKRKLDFAIFKNAKQYTAIVYDENCIDKCCEELNKIKDLKKTIIYVFSYDHTYEVEDFKELKTEFTVKPIPEAIINVYRKISKLKNK